MRAGSPTGRTLLLFLALILGPACSTAPPVAGGSAIVIGIDVSRDTADQAVADGVVNAVRSLLDSRYRGRVEGVPVSVKVLDDSVQGRPDPARAAANMRYFVADPRVLGVVGPIQSSLAVSQIPIAAAAHLVLVSPGNTNACLTRASSGCDDLATQLHAGAPVSYFRVLATDDAQGDAAAAFTVANLKIGPIAVASDGGTYGRALAEAFSTALRKQGGAVAVRSDFDPHSGPAVTTFLQAGADAGARGVFFGGRDGAGACLVRAAMASTLAAGAPFLGGDGILTPTCLQDAGPNAGTAAPGLYAVATGPGLDDVTTAAALDAAGALLEAIARATRANGGNTPGREEVRSQMAATRSYPGHWGKFGFDSAGDTTLRVYSVWSAAGTPPAWVPLQAVRLPG